MFPFTGRMCSIRLLFFFPSPEEGAADGVEDDEDIHQAGNHGQIGSQLVMGCFPPQFAQDGRDALSVFGIEFRRRHKGPERRLFSGINLPGLRPGGNDGNAQRSLGQPPKPHIASPPGPINVACDADFGPAGQNAADRESRHNAEEKNQCLGIASLIQMSQTGHEPSEYAC